MTLPYESLFELLKSRHSCRAFRSEQVPQRDIEAIVRAAGRVPSWCNSQPWQVTITSGDTTDLFRKALQTAAETSAPEPDLEWPLRYTGVYQSRRRTCGFQLYDAAEIPKTDRAATTAQMMENYRLFGAPHVAIVSSEADRGPYGVMDTGGFIATFTLAAQALGVASVPQAAVAAYAPMLHQYFDIPDNRQILCAISFGYEDSDHPINRFRTERADLTDIISWH